MRQAPVSFVFEIIFGIKTYLANLSSFVEELQFRGKCGGHFVTIEDVNNDVVID